MSVNRLSPIGCRPALLMKRVSPIWPMVRRRRRSRQRHRDLALRVDGDAGGVLRDGDGRLHRIALRVDDAALRVHLERAVAGIGVGAVRHLDLEEAFAADRDVEIVAGRRQRALRHQPRRADGLDAAADVDADGQDGALVGGLRADPAHMVIDQVLERRALLLEAGGAQVGDVVGDHLDVEFLGRHPGRRGIKCAHGSVSLCRNVGEFFDRGFVQIALLLQHVGDLGVGARHLDHAAHLRDRVDVGLFDEALLHLRGGVGLRGGAVPAE